MKPEDQRIAIAKILGLEVIESPMGPIYPRDNKQRLKRQAYYTPSARDARRRSWPSSAVVRTIPDYLNDLNAIQNARKSLTHEQRVKMVRELYNIIDRDLSTPSVDWSDVITDQVEITSQIMDATAAQWCEAFLRTFDLWEE